MSRETVRQAVANYLTAQNIPALSVYEAMPKQSDPFPIVPGTATTAIAFPFIAAQDEKRLGMGKKQITYTVTLAVECYSTQQLGEDAQSDADAIFESVLEAVRADPQLGTANSALPLLQAGEGDGVGTPDLRLDQDLPITAETETGVYIWARMAITAVEVITSAF